MTDVRANGDGDHACQQTDGWPRAAKLVHRGPCATWRKLDCLSPISSRFNIRPPEDACYRCYALRLRAGGNLDTMGRCPLGAFNEMTGTSTPRYKYGKTNGGPPTGRKPHGDGRSA